MLIFVHESQFQAGQFRIPLGLELTRMTLKPTAARDLEQRSKLCLLRDAVSEKKSGETFEARSGKNSMTASSGAAADLKWLLCHSQRENMTKNALKIHHFEGSQKLRL